MRTLTKKDNQRRVEVKRSLLQLGPTLLCIAVFETWNRISKFPKNGFLPSPKVYWDQPSLLTCIPTTNFRLFAEIYPIGRFFQATAWGYFAFPSTISSKKSLLTRKQFFSTRDFFINTRGHLKISPRMTSITILY